MENEIINVFTLAVKDGKFPDFKNLVEKIVKETNKESGTLTYIYSVSDDEKTAHIVERYKSDSVVSHVERTFSPFAEEFLSLVDVTSLTVYGKPDAAVKAKLDPFGALYMTPFEGFSR
jgi:quinol monooxygenase YgiN